MRRAVRLVWMWRGSLNIQSEVSGAAATVRRHFSSDLLFSPSSQRPIHNKTSCPLITQFSSGSCDHYPHQDGSSRSRSSSSGIDEELVTPQLQHILKGLRNKQRASLAEAITLGEKSYKQYYYYPSKASSPSPSPSPSPPSSSQWNPSTP